MFVVFVFEVVMDMEWSDSKYEHREERDDESPMQEQYDDL